MRRARGRAAWIIRTDRTFAPSARASAVARASMRLAAWSADGATARENVPGVLRRVSEASPEAGERGSRPNAREAP